MAALSNPQPAVTRAASKLMLLWLTGFCLDTKSESLMKAGILHRVALLVSALTVPCAAADPQIGSSRANGDPTFLSAYEIPAERLSDFQQAVKKQVARAVVDEADIWLTYEELRQSSSGDSTRFFVVHFPTTIAGLTEPNAYTPGLIDEFGRYRVQTELSRQVPDWCSTLSIYSDKLPYAYLEYLWLRPGSLDAAGRLLARRGEILRELYGTGSNGALASESFVAMVAPFQIMNVFFSSKDTLAKSQMILARDLVSKGLAEEWAQLHEQLGQMTSRRESRAGRYLPDLSVDY